MRWLHNNPGAVIGFLILAAFVILSCIAALVG